MFRTRIFSPVILLLTLSIIVFPFLFYGKIFSFYGFLFSGNLLSPFLLIGFSIIATGGLWVFERTSWGRLIKTRMAPLRPKIPFMCLIIFQFALAIWFMRWVNHGILVHDDHGDTLYGLHILEQAFPGIVNYNPFWNAGALEWEPIRHGTLNLFFITRPLRLFFSLPEAYSLIIPLIFIFGLPWLIYYSLGLMQFSPLARLLGVMMAFLPHLQYAYWMEVGCMPAVLSSALFPVIVLTAVRLFLMEEPKWRHLILLVTFLSLALMWMPFVFILILPGLILLLFFQKKFRGKPLLFVVLALLSLALLNYPWIYSFFKHYHVQDFTARSFSLGGRVTLGIFYKPLLVFFSAYNSFDPHPGNCRAIFIKPSPPYGHPGLYSQPVIDDDSNGFFF
ncbi:MAG: hypothetical protein V2B13_10980 [Pseudomonadota bacterium]